MHCRATARHAGALLSGKLGGSLAREAEDGRQGRPRSFHSKALRGLQIVTRYRWPRFVATIGQDGHGVIDDVTWIDAPATTLLLR